MEKSKIIKKANIVLFTGDQAVKTRKLDLVTRGIKNTIDLTFKFSISDKVCK